MESGPSAFKAFTRASLPFPNNFKKLLSLESLESDFTVSFAVALSEKKKEYNIYSSKDVS